MTRTGQEQPLLLRPAIAQWLHESGALSALPEAPVEVTGREPPVSRTARMRRAVRAWVLGLRPAVSARVTPPARTSSRAGTGNRAT